MRFAMAGWVGSIVLVFAVSCASVGQDGERLPLPPVQTGRATRHAVESEQLRTVMNELRRLDLDRRPQELETPGGRQARLREAAAIAGELSGAAVRIAGVAGEVGLDRDEGDRFLALANRLGKVAQTLSRQAARGESEQVERAMDEINATCAACHDLFRDSPRSAEGQTS